MTTHPHLRTRRLGIGLAAVGALVLGTLAPGAVGTPATEAKAPTNAAKPLIARVTHDVAHDTSAPLRQLVKQAKSSPVANARVVPEHGSVAPAPRGGTSGGDAAVQAANGSQPNLKTIQNFEGLSNQDNFDVLGSRVNPPDPNGAVGPKQYVEIVNLVFAVYSKTGKLKLGPASLGSLWAGFSVPDCARNAGDPVVLHDQLADRWILTQFTSVGPEYWNCVAVSKTPDATGAYYRYAFSTGVNFPDYPKYGVWSDTYTITTREFGPTTEYGIGVYGLEKSKMLQGKKTRVVSYYIDGNVPENLPLVGDGLLPADMDGTKLPPDGSAIPLVGSQDDDWSYGATSDALNVWNQGEMGRPGEVVAQAGGPARSEAV